MKTLVLAFALTSIAAAAQAQEGFMGGHDYGSRFDNAPGLTGAPGLYAPGLGQRFDQEQPRNSYDSYNPVPQLSRPSDDDYGYHPRDSYDWHHGYDRGE